MTNLCCSHSNSKKKHGMEMNEISLAKKKQQHSLVVEVNDDYNINYDGGFSSKQKKLIKIKEFFYLVL